jgi:hypothetical protein
MNKLRFLLVIALLSCTPPSAIAQSGRTAVSGTAKDTAGSVLQGARVQLDPGKQAVTDGQGQFPIPDVAPGDYTLTVAYVGLSDFTKPLKAEADKGGTMDALLEVASQTDSVVVTTERVSGFYTGSPIDPNQRESYKPSVILGQALSPAKFNTNFRFVR